MASFLRSLLLLGLPGFEAPLDSGQRQIKALHQANRLAFLGQHALLYCLLDDNGEFSWNDGSDDSPYQD